MVMLRETKVDQLLLHQFLRFVDDEKQREVLTAATNLRDVMHCNLEGMANPAFVDLNGIQKLNHKPVEAE
jgi:hypothetical protein